MSFQIQVNRKRYNFVGPYSRAQLPTGSGVYMVMGKGGVPIYIGESRNIHQRVTGGHERERCWAKYGTGNSIRCVMIPNRHARVSVEQAAIRKWSPVCNRT